MLKYKQLDVLNQVAEFHTTFNHPILDTPTIPSKERCDLRVSLIQEELNELSEAIHNKDLVEIADALCDLQYVLSGAILEFGLAEKFPELFNEVQRSNMSKACKNNEEADLTQESYKNQGITTTTETVGNVIIIKRYPDNKILKNINYSSAQLADILNK